MKNIKRFFLSIIIFTIFGFSSPTVQALGIFNTSDAWVDNEIKVIKSRHHYLDEKMLRVSLTAYENAIKRGMNVKPILTVIDYQLPSTEKRLWVFDLRNGSTLINTWVAHGKNSGDVNSTSFSNTPSSLKSSIGVFVTANTYFGNHGLSLRIKGLEHGFNDNAYRREVVIHPAAYVSAEMIRYRGRIGRSWGCPAVSPSVSKQLINIIKDKSIIVAYYPDHQWLSRSAFLA